MTGSEKLAALEAICEYIEREAPERRALPAWSFVEARYFGRLTVTPGQIDRRLRAGVLYYSTGLEWRLYDGWREVLAGRRGEWRRA